jgi:hypothetical protein
MTNDMIKDMINYMISGYDDEIKNTFFWIVMIFIIRKLLDFLSLKSIDNFLTIGYIGYIGYIGQKF